MQNDDENPALGLLAKSFLQQKRKTVANKLVCNLTLGHQTSNCRRNFGAHLAINGIANNIKDFYCSNFHENGYPWILGW